MPEHVVEKPVIWCLMSCNEWKEWSSMSIVVLTTDEDRLHDTIKEKIECGDMGYAGIENISDAVARFEEDWLTRNIADVNGSLEYGLYESFIDGEVC